MLVFAIALLYFSQKKASIKTSKLVIPTYNWRVGESCNCAQYQFSYGMYEEDSFGEDDVLIKSDYSLLIKEVAENTFELTVICDSFWHISGANYFVEVIDSDLEIENGFGLTHEITSHPTEHKIIEKNHHSVFNSYGMGLGRYYRFEVFKNENNQLILKKKDSNDIGREYLHAANYGTSIEAFLDSEWEWAYDVYVETSLVRME